MRDLQVDDYEVINEYPTNLVEKKIGNQVPCYLEGDEQRRNRGRHESCLLR